MKLKKRGRGVGEEGRGVGGKEGRGVGEEEREEGE